MTQDEVRQRLWMHIKTKHKTGKAAARHWGISESMVSSVLNGRKAPTAAMLEEIGLVRLTVYSERTECGSIQ